MGLDPRTPGSRPEPKADAEPLSHPGAPENLLLKDLLIAREVGPEAMLVWFLCGPCGGDALSHCPAQGTKTRTRPVAGPQASPSHRRASGAETGSLPHVSLIVMMCRLW